MKRIFITNLGLLLLINLLVKPFWIFGIDRSVQNAVGSEEYGLYFSLFSFSLLLNILLDLGITNYNNRNISQHNQLLSKHLSSIIVLRLLLGIVYAVICFSIAFFIGYDTRQFSLLLFLVANQFLLSFILYLRSNLSGLQLFKTDSLISVLDRSLMIIICAILLWGNLFDTPFRIEWFIYAQTAAYLITALITFLVVLSKTSFLKLHYDRNFFIVFLRQSYPYALLILLMAFYNRIDSVMLERMLPNGDSEAGIYAQSFRVLDAVSMFSFLFAGLLLPMFSKMLKNKESVQQLLHLSARLLLIPAMVFIVACITWRTEMLKILYHHNHLEYSAIIFSVIINGFFFVSITYLFGTLLTANGNLKALNIMASIGMGLNIILNLILIPRYGALGCAISSLSTQVFTGLAQAAIVYRLFKFNIQVKTIVFSVIFLGGIIGMAFLANKYISNWFVAAGVFTGAAMIFAFALKLVDLKAMFRIVKYGDEK